MQPIHDQIEQAMAEFQKQIEQSGGPKLNLPPPVVSELETQYTSYTPGQKLTATFPFQKRFTQPAGFYQGGMLGAAFDNVFGPLCYFAMQKPCVTLDMALQFVRPALENEGPFTVECSVVSKTRQTLRMQGQILNTAGKLIALAQTTCIVPTRS